MTTNLKDLIALDVEKQKREILARDATALLSKLIGAGIIEVPVMDRVKVHDSQVRYDLDGIAFNLRRFDSTEYDGGGNEMQGKSLVVLTASRICTSDGCNRYAGGLYVSSVTRAADLKPLFFNMYSGEEIASASCRYGSRCGGLENDDLVDLPF